MPVLSNPRHERFAQELAAGKTATEAYELAGYKPDAGHASRLAGNGSISVRVAEILGRASNRVEVTVASLMGEAEEARQLAMSIDQPSAAIAAIREKGVLSGMRIERAEHGSPGEFDKMNADELRDFVTREAEALGFCHAVPAATNGSGKPH